MLNTAPHATSISSSPQPPVSRIKHVGLLTANSIAVYIDEANDPFLFQLTRDLTFGRHTPNVQVQPAVDLTTFGAYEKGVSRLHAVIRRSASGAVQVEDLASGNGTWLNGLRMEPHIPMPLKSGDHLTLGKLTLEIYLADGESKPAESGGATVLAPDDLLLKTLPVMMTRSSAVTEKALMLLPAPAPRLFTHYHASVSLGLQNTLDEVGALLAKLIALLLKLKNCEVKLTLRIDARGGSCFDEPAIQAIQNAARDLKLDESEFTPY